MKNYLELQGLSGRYVDGILNQEPTTTAPTVLTDEQAYQEYLKLTQ